MAIFEKKAEKNHSLAHTAERMKEKFFSGKKAGASTLLRKITPYAMVRPALSIFMVFMIFSAIYMLYISFFDWNMIKDMKFVGLDNYIKMFTDPDFLLVMSNTFQYMFMMVPMSMILSLAIAMYLKKNTFINRLLQNVMFLPTIVSLVSISFVWIWIMDSDKGLLNYLLSFFGVEAINWLGDPKFAMFSVVLVNVWKSLGYYVLIFVAALQGIPSYLYEAAALDKAKPMTVFFKITLPMLSPTLFFLTLTSTIGSFKTFESISLMTNGGPMESTNTLVFELYRQGFVFYNTGYAAAMGVFLMALIGLMTFLYFKVLQKKVHYQ